MTDYLLSIELRKANSLKGEVGETVVLQQAWCHDAPAALHEFVNVTGRRFTESLYYMTQGDLQPTVKEIEADPRIKNG